MAWQFTAQQPIYKQIVEAVEMRIINGSYQKGERLPSVRDLALIAAVNPNTMQRALAELEQRDLIKTQRTSGRTVTDDEEVIMRARQEKAAYFAETFLKQMHSLGLSKEEALECIAREAAKQVAEQGKQEKEENDGSHA